MDPFKPLKIISFLFIASFFLNSCAGGDARKFPDDSKLRVKKTWKKDGDSDFLIA